ncbi:hypothetical protein R3P38DRAFT_3039640 [Favolaschia claudopus]|uniref:Uncharacterized protein n=1 Tax=Favolaschia claudopus TaxID=2862362 RepID=A0AAW0A9H9_9AGAR
MCCVPAGSDILLEADPFAQIEQAVQDSGAAAAPYLESPHARMDKTIVELIYNAPFPPAARSHLESLLIAAAKPLELLDFKTSNPSEFYNELSLPDLLKCRKFSFGPNPYVLVADGRTLQELNGNGAVVPTIQVVLANSFTPMQEWQAYKGPGDLGFLAPFVRLALLRAMMEERVRLDRYTTVWFWEDDKKLTSESQYNDSMWQMKALRATPNGAHYACVVYTVKDRNAMHALYSTEAAKTDGVFHGLKD